MRINLLTIFAFAVSLMASTAISAQEKFADLSAKERIKVAEQEEIEAKSDSEFQRMMQTGHELFKQRHYLKAIHRYEEAQERRPYNVYPKVIIADIELSMKDTLEVLRKEEKKQQSQQDNQRTEAQKSEKDQQEMPVETEAERLKRVNDWEKREREKRADERERTTEKQETVSPQPTGDIAIMSVEDFRKELGKTYPSGISEEIIQDGNKTITKRVKVADGKGDEYKRVEHGWGGIFFFKNGDAITERMWKQETE